MVVRTKKVDILALARSSPGNPFASKRSGGGGSFGVGLAHAIDGFEMNDTASLNDGEDPTYALRAFKVAQEGATYTLLDDAGGRFELYSLDDDGIAYVDDDGYAYLHGSGAVADINDVEYTIIIRVTLGAAVRDYTRTIKVENVPFFYDVDASTYVFAPGGNQGDPICTFVPQDERLTLAGFIIVDGPAGIFDPGGNELIRSYGATTAGQSYTVDLRFFLTGDGSGSETAHEQTFTFDCVSDPQ